VKLDRDDIGRMKISRALIWAFRVALVLLWLALSLKYWMIAGVLSPVVLALTLWAVGAGGARCARTILTQAPLCGSPMHALAQLYPRRLSFASLESCRACACQDESTEQVGFITGSLCCAPQENRMSDFRFGSHLRHGPEHPPPDPARSRVAFIGCVPRCPRHAIAKRLRSLTGSHRLLD
jgi:hypothetical protein